MDLLKLEVGSKEKEESRMTPRLGCGVWWRLAEAGRGASGRGRDGELKTFWI